MGKKKDDKNHTHRYTNVSTQVVDEGRTVKTVRTCSCGDSITSFARNPYKDR